MLLLRSMRRVYLIGLRGRSDGRYTYTAGRDIPATLVVGLGLANSTFVLAGVWHLREIVPECRHADGFSGCVGCFRRQSHAVLLSCDSFLYYHHRLSRREVPFRVYVQLGQR